MNLKGDHHRNSFARQKLKRGLLGELERGIERKRHLKDFEKMVISCSMNRPHIDV